MKLGRRDFLKGLGGFIAGLLSSTKCPSGDDGGVVYSPEASTGAHWDGSVTDDRYAVVDEWVWDEIRQQESLKIAEDPSDWFKRCSDAVFDEAIRLDVPMRTREIKCYLPSPHPDWPTVMRFSVDWYDQKRRYGFVIKWNESRHWPSMFEIREAARPFLLGDVGEGLGLNSRWSPEPNTVWL
jgi:hypothetical protein